MNSNSAKNIYIKMQSQVLADDHATCMLVEAISKKTQNQKWTITIDKRKFSHEHIRRVSMDKFYGIVFGDEYAFSKLCKALPDILDDVIIDLQCGTIQNSVYDELHKLSSDTFKSLYLLAFKTYAGFQNF